MILTYDKKIIFLTFSSIIYTTYFSIFANPKMTK